MSNEAPPEWTGPQIERRMLDHAEQSVASAREWFNILGFAFSEHERSEWSEKLKAIELRIHEKWETWKEHSS